MGRKRKENSPREPKKLDELLKTVLDARVRVPEQISALEALGIPKTQMTMRAVIAAGLFELAADGNAKAVELIMSICDEKKKNADCPDTIEITVGENGRDGGNV